MLQKDVFTLITVERQNQDQKWGSLEERHLSVGDWLLILKAELDEAIVGWIKRSPSPHSALEEVLQVAAVAVACLEQHGTMAGQETAQAGDDEEWEEGDHHNSTDGLPAHMIPTYEEDDEQMPDTSHQFDDLWEAGEDAEAEASDHPGYYETLRNHQEKLKGNALKLMEWAKKNNAESRQPASLVEYRILAGEIDKLIGKGNHNLLLGTLLGFPIHSQSRPGDQFVRFLLHFIRPLIDKVGEDGQVIWEMKGNRRVKAKATNPKFVEEFPTSIRLAWSQINMEADE